MNKWISVADRLPEIPSGEKSSRDVLAGGWVEKASLPEGHPHRRKFIMGVCRVLEVPASKEFPIGRRWHTFSGPSHDEITHWMSVPVPPEDPTIQKKTTKWTPPDDQHTYWCEKCQSWTMFQFEDYNMCDECAIAEAFSDDTNVDDSLSAEELILLRKPVGY